MATPLDTNITSIRLYELGFRTALLGIFPWEGPWINMDSKAAYYNGYRSGLGWILRRLQWLEKTVGPSWLQNRWWRVEWDDGVSLDFFGLKPASWQAARRRKDYDGVGTYVGSRTDGDEEARLLGAKLIVSTIPI